MSRWPGVNWVWLPEVDSTNTLAERLMEAWFAEELETPLPPTLICADSQWAGRGRGERTWQSPPGGVYASLLLWVPIAVLPWLPLAAGVAVHQGVKQLLPQVPVTLKWPNDLQVGGRKLGGVLCASRVQGARAWTVTGVGVNVLAAPQLAHGEREAVSLRELGFAGTLHQAREVLLDTFVTTFPALLEQGQALRSRWQAVAAHLPGEAMAVRTASGVLAGTFRGLSPEGLLLLEVGGEVRAIPALELA